MPGPVSRQTMRAWSSDFRQAKEHIPILGCILNRIRDQVDQHLLQTVTIPIHQHLIDLIQMHTHLITSNDTHFLKHFGDQQVQFNRVES